MIDALLLFLAAIVGGLGFRLRGGLYGEVLGWGATTARIVAWAIPMAALNMMDAGARLWPWFPVLIGAWWAGTLLGWWGTLDMGRQRHTLARDFVLHSLRGVCWVLPPLVALATLRPALVGPWMVLPLAAGLSCGACYLLGYWIADRTPLPRRPAPWPQGGTEWGEVLFGALVAVAFAVFL